MPCWWMPASCANALRPTTALFGCGQMPVIDESRRLVAVISSVRTPLVTARLSPRTRSAVQAARRRDLLRPYAARDREALAADPQRHHQLLERGVARALADAVHRHLDLARA